MPELDEDETLYARITIDHWMLLHSNLTPEQFLDRELEKIKQSMLNRFYERFPGQRPIGDEDAEG